VKIIWKQIGLGAAPPHAIKEFAGSTRCIFVNIWKRSNDCSEVMIEGAEIEVFDVTIVYSPAIIANIRLWRS
jgi:hypothetical protein